MSTQIERQYNTPAYVGKRPLNISLFADVTLSDERRIELDEVLAYATIPDIQRMFAEGTLSSVELVTYYIDRIRRYDIDGYNSVLELNPDVFEIANSRDRERSVGQVHSTMHGIPILLKDNIGTGDKMHNTAGSKAMETSHCDRDSHIAACLREAGAIILGKTNLSQWANFMSFDSANGFSVLGGQTHNAYGRFDVGGSSSGSGAAAGMNFATVTIGTETSGSLVSPASQNSLCTIKASLGLISRDRIIPITELHDTAGPMTRNMTDLVHLLNVIRGVDDKDPQTHKAAVIGNVDFVDYLQADALQGKRIGVVKREAMSTEGMDAILEKAIETMREAGAEVIEIEPLHIDFNFLTFFFGMHRGVNEYLAAIGSDLTLASIAAFNDEDLPNRAPFQQGLLELCVKTPLDPATEGAYQAIHQQNYDNAANGTRNALSKDNLDALVDINTWGTYGYAPSGFPAVCVQAGYLPDGEPMGITFWGDYLQDANLIAMAYAFEQASKVWQPPTPILPSQR